MLDIKLLRNDPQLLERALLKSKGKFDKDGFMSLDVKRRELIFKAETMKSDQNAATKLIPQYKKEGKDTSSLMEEMRSLSNEIKELDQQIRQIDEQIAELVLSIPYIRIEAVPLGDSVTDNQDVRKWGTPAKFDFEPKAHWDIGEALDILDFSKAAKVTGARFTFYKNAGARLERALMNFMLDLHTTKHGYVEGFPPFMVHRNSIVGTGQLP